MTDSSPPTTTNKPSPNPQDPRRWESLEHRLDSIEAKLEGYKPNRFVQFATPLVATGVGSVIALVASLWTSSSNFKYQMAASLRSTRLEDIKSFLRSSPSPEDGRLNEQEWSPSQTLPQLRSILPLAHPAMRTQFRKLWLLRQFYAYILRNKGASSQAALTEAENLFRVVKRPNDASTSELEFSEYFERLRQSCSGKKASQLVPIVENELNQERLGLGDMVDAYFGGKR